MVRSRDKTKPGTMPTRKNLREVAATRMLATEADACDVATVVARLDRGERNCAGSKLAYARFSGIALRWVILDGADLRGACFDDCDLSFASLRGANLAGASFQGATLDTAILADCCLREADLRGANLARATIDDIDLTHAVVDESTVWPCGFDATGNGAFVLGRQPVRDSQVLLPQSTGEHPPLDSREGGSQRGVTRWLGECAGHGLGAELEPAGDSFAESYDDDSLLNHMFDEPLTKIRPPSPQSRVACEKPGAWINRELLEREK